MPILPAATKAPLVAQEPTATHSSACWPLIFIAQENTTDTMPAQCFGKGSVTIAAQFLPSGDLHDSFP